MFLLFVPSGIKIQTHNIMGLICRHGNQSWHFSRTEHCSHDSKLGSYCNDCPNNRHVTPGPTLCWDQPDCSADCFCSKSLNTCPSTIPRCCHSCHKRRYHWGLWSRQDDWCLQNYLNTMPRLLLFPNHCKDNPVHLLPRGLHTPIPPRSAICNHWRSNRR